MRTLSLLAIAICARSVVAAQSSFTLGYADQVDSDVRLDQHNVEPYGMLP